MGKAQQMERIIAKGQLVPFLFSKTAVAASSSAVALNVMDTSVDVAEYVMPFEYDVVAVTASVTNARTAGTLTVDATINGTVTGLQAVIDGTNTLRKHTTQPRGRDGGAAGSRLGVKLTTDSGFLPVTTNDVLVTVWCIVHLEGI